MAREASIRSLASFHRCSQLAFLVVVTVVSAQSRDSNCRDPEDCDPSRNYFPESERISIKFATNMTVSYSNTYVDITAPAANITHELTYRIITCGCPRPTGSENRIVLFTRPNSLYVSESPSLALLQMLDSLDTLSYVNSKNFIYSPEIRGNDQVEEIMDANFTRDYTKLEADAELSAGVIGSFDFTGFSNGTKSIPFIVVPDAIEESPLGRAEFIKVIGVFLGAAKETISQFDRIESEYQDASRRASQAIRRPSVLLNRPDFKGPVNLSKSLDEHYNWSLPHGGQYVPDLLDDANADYLYETTINEATLIVPFSEAIEEFKFARFYLNIAHFPANKSRDSLEEFMKDFVDPETPDLRVVTEMATLKAVQCDNVWHREKRISENGEANDIFESAIIRPDDVLKDYIAILHPSVDLGDREMVYMGQYKATTNEFTKDCPYNDFAGPPPNSKVYIDIVFSVDGLNRFEIERLWEGDIQPELKSLDLNLEAEYDIMFQPSRRADETTRQTETRFILRALIDPESETQLNSAELRRALSRGLGRQVSLVILDSTSDDDGLSSAAIGVIVVVCLVAPVILLVLVFRLVRRKKRRAFENEILAPGPGPEQVYVEPI